MIITDIEDVIQPIKAKAISSIYAVPDQAVNRNGTITIRPDDVIEYISIKAEYHFEYISPDERSTRIGTASVPARVAVVFSPRTVLVKYQDYGEYTSYKVFDLVHDRVARSVGI